MALPAALLSALDVNTRTLAVPFNTALSHAQDPAFLRRNRQLKIRILDTLRTGLRQIAQMVSNNNPPLYDLFHNTFLMHAQTIHNLYRTIGINSPPINLPPLPPPPAPAPAAQPGPIPQPNNNNPAAYAYTTLRAALFVGGAGLTFFGVGGVMKGKQAYDVANVAYKTAKTVEQIEKATKAMQAAQLAMTAGSVKTVSGVALMGGSASGH